MRRSLAYSCLFLALVACGGGYRAPVEQRPEQRPAKPQAVPASYIVRRGDTLFSIAWRYGLDYRGLAGRNGISAPYTIFPGQEIYLKQKPGAAPKVKSTPRPPARPAATAVAKTSTATPSPAPKTAGTANVKGSSSASDNAVVSRWRWPTSGRITRGYSSSLHKGIDIAGDRGDSIKAVAAGRVVYAGSGIVGYGELLIVKHNDVYLSAYGHNNRLLVAEGTRVEAGQKIAEKGSSGTNKVKLHFEIRKEGKPIDPKRLLPAR